MNRHILCAGAILALSACGSGSDGSGNVGSAEKAPAAAASGGDIAATMQPGEYEVTTQFVSMEAPNMPAGMANAIKGRTEANRNCVTEKDLKEANSDMFAGKEAKQCSQNSIKLAGGRMSGTLKCGSGAGTSTLTIDGSYTASTYQAEMKMEAGGVTTHVKMAAKRVGECSAADAKEG
jgi:hypothetical protein